MECCRTLLSEFQEVLLLLFVNEMNRIIKVNVNNHFYKYLHVLSYVLLSEYFAYVRNCWMLALSSGNILST